MSLPDLPDEILNLISIRLNGFDNCSLWMASDSILRQRLVNNVITDFDIKYTIPGRYLWPGNFLKKLSKLSRLSLVADNIVLHIPLENVKIHPIPTLKYLKLSFGNMDKLFIDDQNQSCNHPTGPSTSSSNECINLNDYYTNLEHLEMISPWIEDSFLVYFVGFLPQNLQTLSIRQNFLKLDSHNPSDDLNRHISKLPRSLTSLHLDFDCHSLQSPQLDLSKLPPNLTNLTTNVFFDEKSYPFMPKTMKKLLMYGGIYNIEKLSPCLPTGLEELAIMIDQNPATLTHLANLQYLHLMSARNHIQINDFITVKCPPKLKKFRCNNLDLTGLQLPSKLFGNSLTELSLPEAIGVRPELISSLPQSITNLTLSKPPRGQDPFPFFSLLPKNLKALDLNFDIVETVSLLPDSLTCLSLTNSHPLYFDRFPPKLETLMIRHNLPLSITRPLPETLTCFKLYCTRTINTEIVRMLPRGLKELVLEAVDEISDADAADLPPSLEILSLPYNIDLTDDVIPLLPRSLVQLNIESNSNFTDECVKHLPRNLTMLHMNSSENITSESCKDLPRYLKELYLRLSYWDPDVITVANDDLPPFLQVIHLEHLEAQKTWRSVEYTIIKGP